MSKCIFCEIVAGNIPCQQVHADDDFFAFNDVNPQAPTHILVIPRRHISGLPELGTSDHGLAAGLLLTGAAVAEARGLVPGGYRFVINSGPDGGQTVDHLHLHILGGRGLAWPPG